VLPHSSLFFERFPNRTDAAASPSWNSGLPSSYGEIERRGDTLFAHKKTLNNRFPYIVRPLREPPGGTVADGGIAGESIGVCDEVDAS
jgi:hypothetical protein